MRKFTAQLYTTFFVLMLSFAGITSLAQMGFVKGTVSNYKETLEGVSIIVEGKGKATHTNTTGNYTLQLKPGTYTLIISYVGHQRKSIQVAIANKQVLTVDIELIKIEDLQKVTVVGTRSKIIRSNTQTVAPIDIISSKELLLTGQVEPTQMINFIAPSFNSSRQTLPMEQIILILQHYVV